MDEMLASKKKPWFCMMLAMMDDDGALNAE